MARYAMIDDASQIVVNVIEWDGDEATWRAPLGYTMVDDTGMKAGPGFTYANGTFTPPPGGMPVLIVRDAPEPQPAKAKKKRK